MTRDRDNLSLIGLLADFRLLITLFLAFRLLSVLVYQPLIVGGFERGVTAGGDFFYYFQLGSYAREGLLPFRDWWSEFPPIPAILNTIIAVGFGGNGYPGFAIIYGILMTLFDLGNLVRMRQIGMKLHGGNTGMALAWIYALSLAPAVFIWWNFEPLVAFLLLSALWALLNRRDGRSAVWALVGALTKFTPAIILGAVWRYRPPQKALRYSLITLGGFAVVYALLFAQNSAMTAPSLVAQFNKASYQTVWALLDGNYTTGNFGAADERFDPANAYRINGNPAVIPGVLRLGAAALIGAFIFWRTKRFDDRGLVAFTTLTLLIFFLQAQGWSPQWLAQIVPLLLLCFPTRNGVTLVVLLSGLVFIEYPFLFMRTGDTGGVVAGAQIVPFAGLVLGRTLLLVMVCVALYRRLRVALPNES
jgi:hypothetical protein